MSTKATDSAASPLAALLRVEPLTAEAVADLQLGDFLSFRLTSTANALSRQASNQLRPFGLALPEWRTLATAGAYEPLTAAELGRRTYMDRGLVSRTLKLLAQAELIERTGKGRNTPVRLTPRGRALYEEVLPRARERQRRLLAALSVEERTALYSALEKLRLLADGES